MITRTTEKHPFECQFCNRTFAREATYDKHYCKTKKRNEQFKTPTGQLAWEYYQRWMKYKHRAVHTKDAFLSSRSYNSLLLFVEHVRKLKFPDVDIFIRLMVQRKYDPPMWCSDEVYAEYLEHLDRTTTPHQQLIITLRTLDQVSSENNIDVSDIFTLNSNEIIMLIQKRKLSPWVLLRSRKFSEFFTTLSTEQKQIIKAIIRFDYWTEKFSKYEKELVAIDKAITELQL